MISPHQSKGLCLMVSVCMCTHAHHGGRENGILPVRFAGESLFMCICIYISHFPLFHCWTRMNPGQTSHFRARPMKPGCKKILLTTDAIAAKLRVASAIHCSCGQAWNSSWHLLLLGSRTLLQLPPAFTTSPNRCCRCKVGDNTFYF